MFDLDATLKRLGGDKELLAVLVRVFLEDAPQLMSRLNESAQQQRWDEVHRAAHSLRGLAANLSANLVIERLLEVEQITAHEKSPDLATAQHLLDRLKQSVELTASALESHT